TLLVAAFPTLRKAMLTARLVAEDPPSWLPVPVEGVESGDLYDSWEDPRSGGRVHQGVDIFAARETPVRSTTRGVVARQSENRLGGRTVTVIGPGGQRHYYAHLEAYAEAGAGDWVEPGDVLGYVGTSGNAAGTSPHLHYGIYGPGGPVNPFPLLTAAAPGPRAAPGETEAEPDEGGTAGQPEEDAGAPRSDAVPRLAGTTRTGLEQRIHEHRVASRRKGGRGWR
ncbi:MAG: M23 family metallopeptidase, partial [Gemmatimonadota bacterium]